MPLSIWPELGHEVDVGDWRDDRIRELEAKLAIERARSVELEARLVLQAEETATLKAQVAELLRKLNQNSSNSHKPPSSDPPGNRKQRRTQAKQKKRKRGGQKGHKGSRRQLLPPELVDVFVDHFPRQCESCWKPLPEIHDRHATRYQFTEVPPLRPHTTEHRRHAVTCPSCSYATRLPYDAMKLPASPFGPRLMALMAMLTGFYHLSRRKAQALLSEVLGVSVSLGALSAVEHRVSEAVEPTVRNAWRYALDADVKHADGTSWLQAGKPKALWTIATKAVTVFRIIADGAKQTLRPLFGPLKGILISDRATALTFWPIAHRQICWAHLLRKFVSFSERDGPAGELGQVLLDCTCVLFEYWQSYRAGTVCREQYLHWMAPVQALVEETLEAGAALEIKGFSGSCTNVLAHEQALWTFLERDDVEPTNNHGERELRAFVLWRKRSFGTQSHRGNLFAERLMTVIHTARKQDVDVFTFLTSCCRAYLKDEAAPSLFEVATT